MNKQFWGVDRLPVRAETQLFARDAPPPQLPQSVPLGWHEKVVPVLKRSASALDAPTSWLGGPRVQTGFWQNQSSYNNPSREHRGVRSVMMEQRLGSKRCLTPAGGLPSVGQRDATAQVIRGMCAQRLDPVITIGSVAGKAQHCFDVDRRGLVYPEDTFRQNAATNARYSRNTKYTNRILKYRKQPGAPVQTETQRALEDLPLYSSFGLPMCNRVKQFDPSVGMPPKWAKRLQARVAQLRPSSRQLAKMQIEAKIKSQAEDPVDDEFSPGDDWVRRGSVERDSTPTYDSQMLTSKRGSIASKRGSTTTVTFDVPVFKRSDTL